MLDIEVVLVMKDRHELVRILRGGATVDITALGRNGNSGKVDLLRHLEMVRTRGLWVIGSQKEAFTALKSGGGVRAVFSAECDQDLGDCQRMFREAGKKAAVNVFGQFQNAKTLKGKCDLAPGNSRSGKVWGWCAMG